MQTPQKIAVAGATGRVGRHVVDVLKESGHHVVTMSRSSGVDVVTGQGLAEALEGVEVIVDTATGPSPEEQAATEFFTTAAHNLQAAGARAGVKRLVVVSIIGTDRFGGGYGAAKVAHEEATKAGPIPAQIVRAAQFHEFVEQLVQWSTVDGVTHLPRMRTQLVAARTVGEELAALATSPGGPAMSEIAGPREESLPEVAKLLIAKRGMQLRVEAGGDPNDPLTAVYESGALLPGPDAKLAGPTFEEWLESTVEEPAA